MRTDKQIEASKINGAKSQGPITEEGKAKSAQNANRHNLSGGHIVLLSNECPRQFKQFSYGYLDTFAPANPVEHDLVNRLIAAAWRLARVSALRFSAMESAIFEVEMWRQQKTHDRTFNFLDSHTRHVLTYLNMDDTEDAQRKLQRYEAVNRRAYNAAFRQLQAMQGDRFNRQPSELPTPVLYSPDPEPVTEPGQPQQSHEPTLVAFTPIYTYFQPENTNLQSEPEPPLHTAEPPLLAKCA